MIDQSAIFAVLLKDRKELRAVCLACVCLFGCGEAGEPTSDEWDAWRTACRQYSAPVEIFVTSAEPGAWVIDGVEGKRDPHTGTILETRHDFDYCVSDRLCSRNAPAQPPRYILKEVETGLRASGRGDVGRTITLDQREMVDRTTGLVMARSSQLSMPVPASAIARLIDKLLWAKPSFSIINCGESLRPRNVFSSKGGR